MRTDPETGAAFRGSQKWLQRAVATRPEILQPRHLPKFRWVSPVADTRFREYQDGAFLQAVGLEALQARLAEFWPRGGAVWDGLAVAGHSPVLVEAKAHTAEFLSSPCGATSEVSARLIASSLAACKSALGADERSDWMRSYYQYANRLAHLWWLHVQGVEAHLVFVNFVGDTDMRGPETAEAWHVAERAADYALGLPTRHPLSDYVHHLHPHVAVIAENG